MWKIEHTVECNVSKQFAWDFWTNVANWPLVDPAVESTSIDGPFAAGANGTTIQRGLDPIKWRVSEAEPPNGALIEIFAQGAVMQCRWQFEESTPGLTRMTQAVSFAGEKAAEFAEMIGPEMEKNLPAGMQRLADAIVRAADTVR